MIFFKISIYEFRIAFYRPFVASNLEQFSNNFQITLLDSLEEKIHDDPPPDPLRGLLCFNQGEIVVAWLWQP